MEDEPSVYVANEDHGLSAERKHREEAIVNAAVRYVTGLEAFHPQPIRRGSDWVAGFLWLMNKRPMSRAVAELQLAEEARGLVEVLRPRLWVLPGLSTARAAVILHVAMLFGADVLLAQREFWSALEVGDYESAHDSLFLNRWAEMTGTDALAIRRTLTLARILRTGVFPPGFA